MNEHLLTDQTRMLESLRAADNDYRGILTAAASLTSSLQSIRIARVNRPGVSGHFTSFESESERHVIIEAVKQLSARVA